ARAQVQSIDIAEISYLECDRTDCARVQHDDPLHNWPARLLHVPTMTSLAWKPIGTYGQHERPRYIALSYTWGRWKLDRTKFPSAPTLQVSGIPWDIPAVDESLFTVEQFQAVLHQIVKLTGVEHVWLDVACIDQRESSPQGALEIGRQAKIFRSAEHVFIWLLTDRHNPLDRTLETHLSILQHISHGLSCYDDGRPLPQSDTWYIDASATIAGITNLPWWSSLWTLQEAFIRPDAFLLNSGGRCITTSVPDDLVRLDSVLEYCLSIYEHSSDPKEERYTTGDPSVTDQILVGGLRRVVEKSGIQALAQRNPLILYTCAKTRSTLRPLDRIYGIMQIFDFRLGESAPDADTTKQWTLNELEIQLGQQLLEKFPVESQLHVHRDRILGRQAWRISTNSSIPDCLASLPFNRFGLLGKLDGHGARLETRTEAGVTHGWFQGKICSFQDWARAVHEYDRREDVRSALNLEAPDSAINIALDNIIGLVGFIQPKTSFKYSLQNPPSSTSHALIEALAKAEVKACRRFVVALLCIITPEENTTFYIGIGLVFMEAVNSEIGAWWKRLGVCSWKVPSMSMQTCHSFVEEPGIKLLFGLGGSWTVAAGLFG
ncbi:hypothetical protein H2198_007204, partial [Neophaeococcomyces mojaviensis]